MSEDSLVKPPKQERSRQTLERILAAARELLRERDFADISVDQIVERAGSSKGSFYQRFGDKHTLLTYLLQEEVKVATEAWSEFLDPARWRDRSLHEVLNAFLDRLMVIYRQRAPLMRAYAGEAFSAAGEIRSLNVQLNRHVLECLRRIVREKASEVRHPDPNRATAFLFTVLISLLPPLFLSPTQELCPEPMSHDVLEGELRLLIRSYLGIRDER